ncbi:MAG: SPASM domain-containing protein [Nitrospirae bacterium]|nr:SPASM domain-containing protein [Nitrospirota bacterium]
MKESVFPKRIEIEFTNSCNSKCIYCPRNYGVGEEGFMSFELFRRIIDEASGHPDVVLQLHRRGESLLHPSFSVMLSYVKGKFRNVQIATNAIALDEEKAVVMAETLDFVSFSLDLPGKYAEKRGVDLYPQVEKNIERFLSINKRARSQVSAVRDDDMDEKDIEAFRRIWVQRVDRVRIYQKHSIGGVFGATDDKRVDRKPCMKPFTDMVIYWDGKVARCNHDWSKDPIGDVSREGIRQIWNNDNYNRIRDEQKKLFFSEDVCKKCDSWYAEEGVQGTGYVFEKDRGENG